MLIFVLNGQIFPDYFEPIDRFADCLNGAVIFTSPRRFLTLKYFGSRPPDMFGSNGRGMIAGRGNQGSPHKVIGFSQ